MSKQSWKTVKIPIQLFENVKDVIPWIGVPSVAEYVRSTVREWNNMYGTFQKPYVLCRNQNTLERLRRDSLYVDNIKDRIEEAKHEEI